MVKKKESNSKANKSKTESKYLVPLEDLLAAGCHFGHQIRRANPKMAEYIYDQRDKVHIFDLAQTAKALAEACEFVQDLVAHGGKICLVGTKRQAKAIIKEESKKTGMPYIYERWLGGIITNWQQIKKSIKKLTEMKQKKETGEYDQYTKKENVLIDREITKLERFFGGLTSLTDLPEVLFVVDPIREATAVKEAHSAGVKVVAIADSNANPDLIDYPIPANDDAVRSIKLIVSKLSEAIMAGLDLQAKTKTVKNKRE